MKVKTYNIPFMRGLMILSTLIILPLLIGLVLDHIIYKTYNLELLPILTVEIIFLIIAIFYNIRFYLKDKKNVIFQKNLIFINEEKYFWHEVKIEYLDITEIFTLSHNIIKIQYFDKKKNKLCNTYIKGKMNMYNTIFEVRN